MWLVLLFQKVIERRGREEKDMQNQKSSSEREIACLNCMKDDVCIGISNKLIQISPGAEDSRLPILPILPVD